MVEMTRPRNIRRYCGVIPVVLIFAACGCNRPDDCSPGSEGVPPHLVGTWEHSSEQVGRPDVLVFPDGWTIVYHNGTQIPGNYRKNISCYPVLDGDWDEWALFVPAGGDGSEWPYGSMKSS